MEDGKTLGGHVWKKFGGGHPLSSVFSWTPKNKPKIPNQTGGICLDVKGISPEIRFLTLRRGVEVLKSSRNPRSICVVFLVNFYGFDQPH